MEQPDSEAIEAGPTGSGAVQEGVALANPSHGNRVQTLRTEPGGPQGISLNLLADMDEPGQLMLALHMVAQERSRARRREEWDIVDKLAKQAVDEIDLLNRPKSA
jgi:hypothetical protein